MTEGPDHRAPEGGRSLFLGLLLAATLLPYGLFPLVTHAGVGDPGLRPLLTALLFLGAGGHVAASFFYYGDSRVRRFMVEEGRRRYLLVPPILVVASGATYLLLGPAERAYFLVAFWCWQVHHFTRQNHGILAFASSAYRIPIAPNERLAITLTDVAAILATLTFVTPYRETFLGPYGWHLYVLALGVYGCAWIAWAVARPWRRLSTAPEREVMVLVLLAFYLPLFVFRDPFSAVYIYLTAHGLQYLVFMGYVAKTPPRRRVAAGAGLAVLCVAGGLAIQALQNDAIWAPYGVTALGFAYGITMWHFVLDAGVWRLSGAFQRAYMRERFPFLAGPTATAEASRGAD